MLCCIGELCNGSTTDSDSVCWGSNPYSPAKNSNPSYDGLLFFCFVEVIHRDSNKGGLPQGKLQPFGEWLQSPWVTSECEAIAHGSVRKNPYSPARKTDLFRQVGFSVIFAFGELYCFAVIFVLRQVIFALRVFIANITFATRKYHSVR